MIEDLESVYSDNYPSQPTIFYWIQVFRNGRTKVDDDTKPGTPAEIGDFLEEKLLKIVHEERRITEEELTGKGSVFNIMKNYRIKKLCSRFVPYFLSREMCDQRMQCCEQNLCLYEKLGDSYLLHNLINEDETPLSLLR